MFSQVGVINNINKMIKIKSITNTIPITHSFIKFYESQKILSKQLSSIHEWVIDFISYFITSKS